MKRKNMRKLNNSEKVKLLQNDIMGNSEWRQTGTPHFESEDHTVYYSRHENQGWKTFIVRKGIARTVLSCNQIYQLDFVDSNIS